MWVYMLLQFLPCLYVYLCKRFECECGGFTFLCWLARIGGFGVYFVQGEN